MSKRETLKQLEQAEPLMDANALAHQASQPLPTWLQYAAQRGWVRLPLARRQPEPAIWLIAVLVVLQVLCVAALLGFLVVATEDLMESTLLGCLIGGGLWVGAVMWLRSPAQGVFASSMALVLLLTGSAWLTGVGLWLNEMPWETVAVLQGVALLVSATLVRPHWVVTVLSAVGAAWLMAAAPRFMWLDDRRWFVAEWLWLSCLLGAALWAAWAWAEGRLLPQRAAAHWAAMADGLCAAVLFGVVVLDMRTRVFGYSDTQMWAVWGQPVLAALASGMALAFLLRRWRSHAAVMPAEDGHDGRVAVAMAWPQGSLAVLGLALVLMLGSAAQPWLAPVVVVASMAAATARWRLLACAGLMALWLLSRFYYDLSWPLATKAAALATMGFVLLVLLGLGRLMQQRAMQRNSVSAAGLGDTVTQHAAGAVVPWGTSGWLPAAAVGMGMVACLALLNVDVMRKEQVVREGEVLHVALVPVDPRSLMQGDYMALRFDMPDRVRQALDDLPGEAVMRQTNVVVQVKDGEARVHRLAKPAETLAANERLMPLKRLKSQWVLVTDAYFFSEGDGERFEQARWGEFRLLPDGRALLVGLSDAKGAPIRSAHDLRNPMW